MDLHGPFSISSPRAHTHRGLGGDERSQHAAARRPRGAEGHAQVTAAQGQAVGPLLRLLRHLGRLVLQHREALQLPVLAARQLQEEVVSSVGKGCDPQAAP